MTPKQTNKRTSINPPSPPPLNSANKFTLKSQYFKSHMAFCCYFENIILKDFKIMSQHQFYSINNLNDK